MKKFLALAIAVLAMVSMTTVYTFAANDNGLVAYYTFDDASNLFKATKGVDGTAIGAPSAAEGKVGGAVSFDGTDDAIHVTGTTLANLSAVTVSAWVKVSGLDPATGDAQYGFVTSDGWANNGEVHNFIRNNGKCETDVGDLWGQWKAQQPSETAIENEKWTLLTNVYDGAANKIYTYLDGKLVNTNETNDGVLAAKPMNMVDFTIGAFTVNGASQRFYKGLMDELRIYNRALSAAEVAELAKPAGGGNNPSTLDPMTAVAAVAVLVPAAVTVITKKKH